MVVNKKEDVWIEIEKRETYVRGRRAVIFCRERWRLGTESPTSDNQREKIKKKGNSFLLHLRFVRRFQFKCVLHFFGFRDETNGTKLYLLRVVRSSVMFFESTHPLLTCSLPI